MQGNCPDQSVHVRYCFEGLSRQVIGAALAVHRELGPGFLESVYDAAMRVSLSHRGVPFESQVPVDISFEGEFVGRARIDLNQTSRWSASELSRPDLDH